MAVNTISRWARQRGDSGVWYAYK